MKIYSKLFLLGMVGIFVGLLFIQISSADTKVIQKNQMSRIGLRQHPSGEIEVFFFSQGQFYYFPEISAEEGSKKASILIQFLKQCSRLSIHDYPTAPQGQQRGSTPVAFRDYTFEF